MRPRLIVDCGGRVLSALLVRADGEVVPCSQEIRQVATRHVSADILFEARATEDRELLWEEAFEALERTGAHNFFQRARRLGLRRPWDAQASADALQLASPLSVLSSPAALADRVIGPALPRVGLAMLGALLDPLLDTRSALPGGGELTPADIDPVVILPAQIGRHARLVLRKLFRRRGFRRLTIVPREIAAAMTADGANASVVAETSETDLHLHRVEMDGERRYRTAASVTLAGLGWNYWSSRVAEALRTAPGAAFERALTSLLTGSPESLPSRVRRGALDAVLDDGWVARHDLSERLRAPLEQLGGRDSPLLLAGEIFTLGQVCRTFGARATAAPPIDQSARNVAAALRSPLVLSTAGSLRVNTFHGEAVEILTHGQLPPPGQACHVESAFRVGGDGAAGRSFLIHLLWGADAAPAGNATLCVLPLELRGEELRIGLHVRRSRNGRRLHGTLEARMPRDVVAGRARFGEELEVRV